LPNRRTGTRIFTRIKQKIPGVEVFIGQLPDYAELFLHLIYPEDSEKPLFGENHNYTYTRTKTLIDDFSTVEIGCFHDNWWLVIALIIWLRHDFHT